jgi:hypothetical protein
MMDFDPLADASLELRNAVEAMGGEQLLAALDELVQTNEEYTVEWFDSKWDDSTADEITEWSIVQLAATGPGIAHAALQVTLRTFLVDEEDEAVNNATTIVPAFVRVVLSPRIYADRYELDFSDLGAWIMHDLIRFGDD